MTATPTTPGLQTTSETTFEKAFPLLRRGNIGPDVQVVQERLNHLGFDTIVDGIFEAVTEESVKQFQRQRRLTIDGIVGPLTWKALIPPTLQRGSAGPDVEYLQMMLRAIGYTLSADGIFGARTQWGVEKFQTDRGLTVDGIVGPLTWKSLLSNSAALDK
ncbi:MAG: peptidoglycan-binding protein [Cyanobacteriota bacterium]|nr:peptidoglycan-binding protein [Cyanobacteriota bacterium]